VLQSAAQHRRRRRRRSLALGTIPAALISAGGDLVARNPAIAGGTTAFLLVVAYVSANALWYQPRPLGHVFLETRPGLAFHSVERRSPGPAPVGKAGAPVAPAQQASDPDVARLQNLLHSAGFYDGPIDGLHGPKTDQAFEAYRKSRPGTGAPAAQKAPPSAPAPGQPAAAVPLPRPTAEVDATTTTADIPSPGPATLSPADIVRVQAGLKAFGNDAIHIDGRVGAETRNAIREFQSLFHMPVTGQADASLIAKMHEVGLIN
jgi:hypothetical protein